MAAAVLVAIYFARWVSRPLGRLDTAARRIADGDLTVRARTGYGPPELRRMIATLRELESLDTDARFEAVTSRFGDVSAIVGDGIKRIVAAEAPLYPNDKRSIHAIRDVTAGETLTADSIRVLRSERNLVPGLHPRYWEVACGAVAANSLSAGDGLQWHHLIRRDASLPR